MASNGWAKLGDALAGVSDARRSEIQNATMRELAQRDQAISNAKLAVIKAREMERLGDTFRTIGLPDGYSGAAQAGINLGQYTKAAGDQQEQRFRQAAVDAPDFGAANRYLMGVANGPVSIPDIEGGVVVANRLIPGGGEISVTPVGQSQIDANRVRGEAAMTRANRPTASRASGTAAAPKLSEIEKMRLNADLDDLKPRFEAALDAVAENEGATAGPGVRRLTDARARLTALQEERKAILDRFSGSLGATVAPVQTASNGERVSIDPAVPKWLRDQIMANPQLDSYVQPDAPVAPPADQINPRAFELFQQSLLGGGAPVAATTAAPAAKSREVVRRGTSNGRKVVQYSDGSIEYAD